MKKALMLAVAVAWGCGSVWATSYLYDREFGEYPPPAGEIPWMTLDLVGNVFTFSIPETTTSPLQTVYFTVNNPGLVGLVDGSEATKGTGLGADAYNLAFNFNDNVQGARSYTVTLEYWDGVLIEPEGGFYSIASFTDGTWAADVPPPMVPDGGFTAVMLGLGLVLLGRMRQSC